MKINIQMLMLVLASFSSFAQITPQDTLTAKVKIGRASHLYIHGSANITDYSCELVHSFSKRDIKSVIKDDTLFLSGAKLLIPVKEFDCGHGVMNRDFQNTLKSDEYPLMSINVNYITLGSKLRYANVIIEIASRAQLYRIEIKPEIIKANRDIIKVAAMQKMKMSDFGIKAPTTLFGLIKVFDELTIDILLYLDVQKITRLQLKN